MTTIRVLQCFLVAALCTLFFAVVRAEFTPFSSIALGSMLCVTFFISLKAGNEFTDIADRCRRLAIIVPGTLAHPRSLTPGRLYTVVSEVQNTVTRSGFITILSDVDMLGNTFIIAVEREGHALSAFAKVVRIKHPDALMSGEKYADFEVVDKNLAVAVI